MNQKQEMFNTVWNHFVVEKNPASIDEEGENCVYRGPNGEKCAFGLFITDEEYKEEMEGICAPRVITRFGLERFEDHTTFLFALQNAHDDAFADSQAPDNSYRESFTEFVKFYLTQVAHDYSLALP